MDEILHCGKIYGSESADLNVRRRLRARHLRSAAGSINSGRHILALHDAQSAAKRRVFDFVPSSLKNRPACQICPIFGTNWWITLERNKDIKCKHGVGEKMIERKFANFKTKALAVRKLKGKENCENEHRETAIFMYNFVQKTQCD